MVRYLILLILIIISYSLFGQSKIDREKINFIESDSRVSLVKKLEQEYILKGGGVFCISSMEVDGFLADSKKTKFLNHWMANLKKKGESRNLYIDIFFPYEDNQVKDTANVIERLQKYYNLTLSVPWLNRLLLTDTNISVTINYIGGLSFGYKVQAKFLTSLAKHSWHGEGYIQKLLPLFNDIAYISIDEKFHKYSRWLILPNKEMLLWHYKGYSVLDIDLDPFFKSEDYDHEAVFVRFSPEREVIGAP